MSYLHAKDVHDRGLFTSCADDPRKRFWRNLADAEIEDNPGRFQVLRLQRGTYFLDPRRKISSILLRPFYKDLWDLVSKGACIFPLTILLPIALQQWPFNVCETLSSKGFACRLRQPHHHRHSWRWKIHLAVLRNVQTGRIGRHCRSGLQRDGRLPMLQQVTHLLIWGTCSTRVHVQHYFACAGVSILDVNHWLGAVSWCQV